MKLSLGFALVAGAMLIPRAWADPCEAVLPKDAGTLFNGTIVYVGDGDSLCVGTGLNGKHWIEVRLADFDAPELSTPEGKRAKAILEREARGKSVSCIVTTGRSGKTTTYDRVLAICRIGQVSVGDLMRRASAPTGGN